jgi:hypothetical protein
MFLQGPRFVCALRGGVGRSGREDLRNGEAQEWVVRLVRAMATISWARGGECGAGTQERRGKKKGGGGNGGGGAALGENIMTVGS